METPPRPVKSEGAQKIKKRPTHIAIPPSPMMQKLGYGTGVAVYRLERSPLPNAARSPWALKKLVKRKASNKELGDRIKDEAKILRKLNHPNIVGFRALMKSANGNLVLAMEECSKSLGDLIELRFSEGLPSYPAENITKVAVDISKALKYLHEEALILHCDIKSFNVLVRGDFEICKLCDFGVSLPLTKEGILDRSKVGEEKEYVGTPPWCPPEILQLEQIVTTKADIYAFGLVLWEMLWLSVPPLPDDSDDENEFTIRQRPCLPDRDYGDEYKIILEIYYCCTLQDYKQRPCARDLIQVLEAEG